MKKILCLAIPLSILTVACNNDNTPKNRATTKVAPSLEDSLYKEVIALHDETMPKMGKIIGYKKVLQLKIDSLDTYLSRKKDAGAALLKKNYEKLLAQLNNAEKGMNEWMEGFNPDPQLPTSKEMVNYFEDQKQKAKKMKEDVFNALDSTAAWLRN